MESRGSRRIAAVLHFPSAGACRTRTSGACPKRSVNSAPSPEDSGRFTMVANYQNAEPPREFRQGRPIYVHNDFRRLMQRYCRVSHLAPTMLKEKNATKEYPATAGLILFGEFPLVRRPAARPLERLTPRVPKRTDAPPRSLDSSLDVVM